MDRGGVGRSGLSVCHRLRGPRLLPAAPRPGAGDPRGRAEPPPATRGGDGSGSLGWKERVRGRAGGRAGSGADPRQTGSGGGIHSTTPPPPPSAADKSARLSRRLPRRPAEDARRRGAGGGRRAGLAALAAAPRSAPQPRGGDPR